MITYSALPKLKHLISSFCRPSNQDLIKNIYSKSGDEVIITAKSTWSFQILITWWQHLFSKKATVLLPDYFCNQALLALRKMDVTLKYYPVTSSLEPDWQQIDALGLGDEADFFVGVNYFGIPNALLEIKKFCQKNKCFFIEDCAHVLRPENEMGKHSDFVLYSPHKLLAIPEGAIITIKQSVRKKLDRKFSAIEVKEQLQPFVKNLSDVHTSNRTWYVKRIIQKLCGYLSCGLLTSRQSSHDSKPLLILDGQPKCSEHTIKMLSCALADIDEVSEIRKQNHAAWCYGLRHVPDLEIISDNLQGLTPYTLVLRITNREKYITFYEKLMRYGACPQTWPDLPPEVLRSVKFDSLAESFFSTTLFLPLHQSISTHKILSISKRISKDTHTQREYKLELCDSLNDVSMNEHYSNLLQSESYTGAKNINEGWSLKKYIFYSEGEPVAYVTALIRNYAMMQVIRINRGPIFLRELSADEQSALYMEIKKLASLRKRRIVLIVPELENTYYNKVMLKSLGFRKRQTPSWNSGYMDLLTPLDELRKRLNAKWRNQLVLAEKNSLELTVSQTNKALDVLLQHYSTFQAEKHFHGVSADIVKSFHKLSNETNRLFVFDAKSDDEIIASILVVRHGIECTYLIGWNSECGREFNANKFLLWNAIKYMQEIGCTRFDLGGIDTKSTSSIAAFKLGLNPKRYELIGEYVAW